MKKLIIAVMIFTLLLPSTIFADEVDLSSGHIEYTSNFTPQDALEIAYDGPVLEGDMQITKNSIITGLEYAKAMENQSNNMARAGGESAYETWTITGQQVVRPFGILMGKYLKKVGAGATTSNKSVSITISGTIFSITIDAPATLSTRVSYSGPTGTDMVNSTTFATHRYFSIIGSGKLVRYTYRVTDEISGNYLRTETRVLVVDGVANTYSNLGALIASTNNVIIRSALTSATKTMSETSWISKVNSQQVWDYVGF